MTNVTDKLVSDMKAVAADARELVLATADVSAEKVVSARETMRATLTDVQAKIAAAERAAVERARATAQATDDYVHESPWSSIGVGALIGLAIGFLLGRR